MGSEQAWQINARSERLGWPAYDHRVDKWEIALAGHRFDEPGQVVYDDEQDTRPPPWR